MMDTGVLAQAFAGCVQGPCQIKMGYVKDSDLFCQAGNLECQKP